MASCISQHSEEKKILSQNSIKFSESTNAAVSKINHNSAETNSKPLKLW